MTIPKKDPNMTIDELSKVGEKFLEAAMDYWEAAHKAGIGGAVMWLESEDNGLVIFTRGEYRQTLLNNIDRIGPITQFGSVKDA